MQYLDQRYYDPAIGRFISPDPIGFAGGLNLYSYVGNNPVGLVDPTGTRWKEILGIGGSALGALLGTYDVYHEGSSLHLVPGYGAIST